VGFGDFYPLSDLERILGAFVILFGVAIFSIIISEFLDLITNIQNILGEQTDDEMLEIFFVLLKSFNERKQVDETFVEEITEFLNYKWNNDKNYFLDTAEDHNILTTLTKKSE